jgi:putative flippase GtrA
VRFSKFTAGSVFSTVLSQAALLGLYGIGHTSALVAGLVGFVAGAIPNFVINWKWTWARNGRPDLVREVLPYLAIIAGGGLAATGITALADHVLAPLITDHGWRTIALGVTNLASYGLLAVLKFALLNKVFGRKATATTASNANGSTVKETTEAAQGV